MIVDGLNAVAPNFTRGALVDWLHGIKDYDVGLQPPIKSMAADCKRGSGVTWWARWQWDAAKKEAFRKPEGPYFSGFGANDYGGYCSSPRSPTRSWTWSRQMPHLHREKPERWAVAVRRSGRAS